MARPKIKDLLAKKEVDPKKRIDLEKGDFLALLIASASIFLPALLLVIAGLALFIWAWVSFFG